MDIDFSGIWSWTVPLWLLFILVLFLVGVLRAPIILEGILGTGSAAAAVAAVAATVDPTAAVPPVMTGGGGGRGTIKKRVRFAD